MKIVFPNPYGYKLPEKNRITSLQKSCSFSDEYATFLRTQNGFSFATLEEDLNHKQYLVESKDVTEGHADLRVLYGLDSGDQYYDLQENMDSFIFKEIFLPIGVDYGGNELVEILVGQFKGYIASLDHEMYGGNSSIEEFVEEFELDEFHAMSTDDRADLLMDEKIGLIWLFAPSIKDFIELSMYCDDDFRGFIIESIDHAPISL